MCVWYVCLVTSNSVTPWTVACQAPLSMEFSRQEYWIGLPFPTRGDLPYEGNRNCISCTSCIGRQIFFLSLHLGAPGKPLFKYNWYLTAHIESNNSINFETYIHQQNHHHSQDNDHVHHQKKTFLMTLLTHSPPRQILFCFLSLQIYLNFPEFYENVILEYIVLFGLTSWITNH